MSGAPDASDAPDARDAPRPRDYFAACAALIGFALGYALPAYARLPNLFYDPIARRFFVADGQQGIAMGYLGQVGWGLAGALLAGAIGRLAFGRRAPTESALALGAAWALSALAIVGAYFTWNNWP